jgi:two-component system LytT family response regulator
MKSQILAFQIGKEMKFLSQSDIIYCQADTNYSIIICSGKKKLLTTKSLKELEAILDIQIFVRIHNSYIINILQAESFSNEKEQQLIMTDGTILNVSRRKKKDFLGMFYKL